MKRIFVLVAGLAALVAPPLQGAPESAASRSATKVPPANPALAPVDPEIPVALLVDLSSGQTLYAREERRRFVPASVTKVMTAYTAFKLIGEGKLSPDTMVMVSPALEKEWSGTGSSMFLKAGEHLTVGQLILGVTTVSANDASVLLGEAATGSLDKWLALMNANASALGMRDTHFGSPNGYPDGGRTYTSARDLAVLAEALTTRYPDLYHRYFGHRSMQYRNIAQVNHDPVTGVVEGADGIKTGFTSQAGYTVVGTARRGSRRLVAVLAGSPTGRQRDASARALLEWGFQRFDSRTILPRDYTVGEAKVQGGAGRQVALLTASEVLASLPRGSEPGKASLSIRYRGPVEAPIAKGQEIAWLRVALPGQPYHDVPLVAGEAVPRANALQRLVNGIVGLFG